MSSPIHRRNESAANREELSQLATQLDEFAEELSQREKDLRATEERLREKEQLLDEREKSLILDMNISEDAAEIGVSLTSETQSLGVVGKSTNRSASMGTNEDAEASVSEQFMRIQNLSRALHLSPLRHEAHQKVEKDIESSIRHLHEIADEVGVDLSSPQNQGSPAPSGTVESSYSQSLSQKKKALAGTASFHHEYSLSAKELDVIKPRFVDENNDEVLVDARGRAFMIDMLGRKVGVKVPDVLSRVDDKKSEGLTILPKTPRQQRRVDPAENIVTRRKDERAKRVQNSFERRQAEVKRVQRGEHRQPNLPIYATTEKRTHIHTNRNLALSETPKPSKSQSLVDESLNNRLLFSSPDEHDTVTPKKSSIQKERAILDHKAQTLHLKEVSLKQREIRVVKAEEDVRQAGARLHHRLHYSRQNRSEGSQVMDSAALEQALQEAQADVDAQWKQLDTERAAICAELDEKEAQVEKKQELLEQKMRAMDTVLMLFKEALEKSSSSSTEESSDQVQLSVADVERVVSLFVE